MYKILAVIILAAAIGYTIYATDAFGLYPIQDTVNPVTQGIADTIAQTPALALGAISTIMPWRVASSISIL